MYKTLLAIGLIFSTLGVYAQDILTLKNGDEIEGKIESVSETEITYIRKDSPNGPVYTIPVSAVFMIKYENGTKEMYGNRVPTYDYPWPEVNKTYAVGDWFEESGISGIVIYVDQSGRHGIVMYPKKYPFPKGGLADRSYSRDYGVFGTNSPDDGYRNLLALKNWAETHNVDFNYFFPEAAHVCQLGGGWYIPACNEVYHIALAFNGGQLAHADKEARKRFNNTLKTHGGKKLDSGSRIASSTEYSSGEYLTVDLVDGTFRTPRKVHGFFTIPGYLIPVHKF